MVERVYTKVSKPHLLMDEILEAHPELRGDLAADGTYRDPKLYIKNTPRVVFITAPESYFNSIDTLVSSHDSTKKTKYELEREAIVADAFPETKDSDAFIDNLFPDMNKDQKTFLKKLTRNVRRKFN